jgi:hypothetical protein
MRANKLVGISMAAVWAGLFFPALVRAQAAAEYGMAASKSTAMASSASKSISSRISSSYSRTARQTSLKVPSPTSKNLQTVMQENRQQLAARSDQGGGTVRVESVPAKAMITVDGRPVDYAPADLQLPAGKHIIELNHPDFLPWRMEVSVSPQESTAVTAQLENKYRSSVTVSIR